MGYSKPSGNGLLLSKEERVENARKSLLNVKPNNKGKNKGNTTPMKQVNSTGFFGQDNVVDWSKELVTRGFQNMNKRKEGRGVFDKIDNLQEEFAGYVDLCNRTKVVPTVSALCFYLGVSRETFYLHANNPNSPYFDDCKMMLEYCHASLETGASESKVNSVAYIFQGKNYFGMQDQTNIALSTAMQQPTTSTSSLEVLEQQVNQQQQLTDYKTVQSTTESKVIEGNVIEK